MAPTLLLAAALLLPAAPLPKEAAPAGPAPYILQLKAGTDGKVTVSVTRYDTVKETAATVTVGPNGQQVVQNVEREVKVPKTFRVTVDELKDLRASTADGKDLTPKEAAAKVGNGSLVLASANGQKVDAAYLRMFKDEIVVLCSPDLVPTAAANPRFGRPVLTPPGGFEVVPLPAPVPGVIGGGIQIQIAPPLPPQIEVPAEKR